MGGFSVGWWMRGARKYREAFDCRYRIAGSLRDDPCAYCGLPPTGYDHVPPLRWAEAQPDAVLELTDFRKVPACTECNSTLAGQVFLTMTERRAHLRKRYRAKYAHYLRMPAWDADELAELSPSMADDVMRSARFTRMLRQRLDKLRRG